MLLGPLLALFLDLGPIWGHDPELARPWLGLVALTAASLATWGLQGLAFARRTQPNPVLDSLLVGSILTLVALALAGASLEFTGGDAPWHLMAQESLRMGGLVALTCAVLPDGSRMAPALVWIPGWFLPALVPTAWAALLAPLATPLLPTLLVTAALLVLAQSTQPHALRSPR
ncbi:MAG: hypothetical protein P1V81_01560 [Planctomycetota bacterium]|nr:hypothetical protein [Planctomycetota bacterium]